MSTVLSVLGYACGLIGILTANEAEHADSDLLHALLVIDAALLIIVGTLLVLRPY